jgi:hypothetical protein
VKITMLAAIVAAAASTVPATAQAAPTPACADGQVVVTGGKYESTPAPAVR